MEWYKKKEWHEFAGAVLAAVLIYRISPVFFLFMMPLVWVFFNRGETWFVYTGALSIAGIFLLSIVLIKGVPGNVKMLLIVLEMSLPTAVFLGVWVLLHDFHMPKINASLIGITGIGILSIPLIIVLHQSVVLQDFFKTQLHDILSGAFGGELLSEYGLSQKGLYDFAIDMLGKNYLASLYMIITASYYLSVKLYKRIKRRELVTLRSFTFDDRFIWFFIIGWFGAILSSYKEIGVASYLFWNTAMLFLYLYGIRGIAIIEDLYEKYSVSKGARLAITIGCIIGLLTPGLNMLIAFGVPVFGASEIWIHYRERRKGHEGHIE